jgi:hypothetical protein
MYKITFMLAALVMLGLSLPVSAQGVMDGTGPIHVKEQFKYSGTIVDCLQGEGITLATVDFGNVVIYGMGPERFWEPFGGKPGIGEQITVEGYSISYNGEVRNIAWAVTLVSGVTVTLRDDSGLPLWRTTGGNTAGTSAAGSGTASGSGSGAGNSYGTGSGYGATNGSSNSGTAGNGNGISNGNSGNGHN